MFLNNEAFFEQMKEREQARINDSYILRHRQRIYDLIAADVAQDLAAEQAGNTPQGEPVEKSTTVLSLATRTMKTELFTVES